VLSDLITVAGLGITQISFTNCNFVNEGDHSMSDSNNYNFAGAKFETKQGNTIIGNNNNTSNAVSISRLEELTDNLIKDIADSNLSSDDKEQLSESIQQVVEQVKSDKPNKMMIKSIINGIPTALSVAANITKLTESYGHWKAIVLPMIGLQ
jgi:hypothetical protein